MQVPLSKQQLRGKFALDHGVGRPRKQGVSLIDKKAQGMMLPSMTTCTALVDATGDYSIAAAAAFHTVQGCMLTYLLCGYNNKTML